MEIDRKEALDRIEKEIKELPEKAQRAIYWVVKNYGLVTKICKEPEMTNEEIQACKETAREKDDYIALALLCVAEMYHNKGAETTEQENGASKERNDRGTP